MTKIFLVLFILLVCSYLYAGKAEESEENTNITENSKSAYDEEESDSIQVVQRAVVADQQDKPLVKYDGNLHEEENFTEFMKDANITQAEAKYDAFFEDLISDSDEIPLENRDDNIGKVLTPAVVPIEENSENSKGQDKIVTVFEDITKAYTNDENSQEDSTIIEEDEHDWRSAENLQSDEKKYANEAAIEDSIEDDKDFSVEDYMNKNIGIEVKGRMEARQPERRQHYHSRPTNVRHYGPPEDHGMLDSDPMRRFGDIMVPRYRPVLTRSGIVYTPTLFPMKTGTSLLDRLSVHHWDPNRVHMNPEPEVLKPRHNRVIAIPQYEDPKMIDDYDYGPNTNTYSYTPVRKVTTQAPPQQIVAPHKFDVFQKLVEASNHPQSQKRTFNEFPGKYHPQRQYPESFGSFNTRRVRRNSWDESPFQDI